MSDSPKPLSPLLNAVDRAVAESWSRGLNYQDYVKMYTAVHILKLDAVTPDALSPHDYKVICEKLSDEMEKNLGT